jgi:hypothetical protein
MKIGNVEVSKKLFALGLLVGLFIVSLLGFWIWYGVFVNFVENYEYGFVFDKYTGKIERIDHNGWVIARPWRYDVHHIDTRPYQVAISANQRVLNAKLVQFNPTGLETFIEWHGRAAGDQLANLQEILKCYAFDRDEGRDCPFLIVRGELAPNQTMVQTDPTKEKK